MNCPGYPRLAISAYLNNVHFNTNEAKMTHSVKACKSTVMDWRIKDS